MIRQALFVLSLAFTALTASACGLVFQSRTVRLNVDSVPAGTRVRVGDRSAIAPAPLEIRRSQEARVVWAEKEGFQPACQIIEAPGNRALVTLDSIPAALGLLIDAMAGTYPVHNKLVAPVQLQPGSPERGSPAGLSDAQILTAWQSHVNVCHRNGRAVIEHADQVTVYSGGLPPNRPYRVLGPVDLGAAGTDRTFGFAYGGIAIAERTVETHYPAEMDVYLRRLACFLYGYDVDAVINADYWAIPGGTVFAKGIAVHFTNGSDSSSAPPATDPGHRLEQLQNLKDRGLITDDEYERKRHELLEGL
jgi:hypothetical protein